jgi:hypothetical protein
MHNHCRQIYPKHIQAEKRIVGQKIVLILEDCFGLQGELDWAFQRYGEKLKDVYYLILFFQNDG